MFTTKHVHIAHTSLILTITTLSAQQDAEKNPDRGDIAYLVFSVAYKSMLCLCLQT